MWILFWRRFVKKTAKINKEKKEKKANGFKIVIVALIILVIITYVIRSIVGLIKNPTNTVIIKQGTIAKEETDVGYIIRNETIVKGENYKNGMEQIIGEGQKIAKDEAIFRYYSNGEDDIKNQIASLDKQIDETMNSQTEKLFSSDTKLLDSQIDEKLKKLSTLNDTQDIIESKKAIDSYITKRAEIVGDLSPKGSKLKELINQRSELQKKLTNGSEYIKSISSGILSYKIDGLEETLNSSDFSKYNKKFLDGLNLKTGKIISTSSEQGKIVDNFNCYIAFTSKTEEANNAEIGDTVTMVLPSTKEVNAKVQYITKEDNEHTTIILNFSEGIDELLNYRKIIFDVIWWSAKGYKVPKTSIIEENNLKYVIRSRAGYLEKVLVKENKTAGNYSVLSSYSVTELADLNYNKKAKTSISLYDEIVIKPTEEQVKSTE